MSYMNLPMSENNLAYASAAFFPSGKTSNIQLPTTLIFFSTVNFIKWRASTDFSCRHPLPLHWCWWSEISEREVVSILWRSNLHFILGVIIWIRPSYTRGAYSYVTKWNYMVKAKKILNFQSTVWMISKRCPSVLLQNLALPSDQRKDTPTYRLKIFTKSNLMA